MFFYSFDSFLTNFFFRSGDTFWVEVLVINFDEKPKLEGKQKKTHTQLRIRAESINWYS